ncbi:hypothetical protein D9757_009739 [Collybiopsis confluens]|uniref:MFS general substrate transporter n=1 Tax=Collybiopsis confluens TaxID=2823264 RepID=A0A8H5GYK0_9AGAR|nr:hypothetical protein D9757_009739 [Collybiopsis confluens]
MHQGLGTGIAAGMTYVPTYAIVSHYFQRRRAFAMMIVASGSSLGAIVHPIMLNNLLKRIGFANTARANAALISAMLLVACLLMRTRLPPNKAPLGLKDAFLKFGKDKSYVLATIGYDILTASGSERLLTSRNLDAALHGLDPTFVFYTLVILNGSSLIGRLSPGLLVHRLGVSNMLIFGMQGIWRGGNSALCSPLVAALAEDQSEIGLGGLIGVFLNVYFGTCSQVAQGVLLTEPSLRISIYGGGQPYSVV